MERLRSPALFCHTRHKGRTGCRMMARIAVMRHPHGNAPSYIFHQNYSFVLISHIALVWPNCPMTIQQIRYRNLILLLAEAGGNQAELARRGETSASYINQILKGVKTKSGTARNIGGEVARKLEKGFSKPRGWMDEPHPARPGNISESPNLYMDGKPLSGAETELILLARQCGLTDDFLQISRKCVQRPKNP